MNTLTVIVPFYNEEKFLNKSVQRLLINNIFEKIILIDNHSTDNSYKIAKKMSLENKNIVVIKSNFGQGKGVAINSKRNEILTSHVVIHDADLEYNPIDIVEMFELSKIYPKDLILGSRFIGNKNRDNVYFRTKLANILLSKFFSIVNKTKITDIATCYKLIPANFFKNTHFKESGFSIEIELVAKFLRSGGKIKEVPISYYGRTYEEGKKISTIDGIKYLINTIKYKYVKF